MSILPYLLMTPLAWIAVTYLLIKAFGPKYHQYSPAMFFLAAIIVAFLWGVLLVIK